MRKGVFGEVVWHAHGFKKTGSRGAETLPKMREWDKVRAGTVSRLRLSPREACSIGCGKNGKTHASSRDA